MELQFYGPRYVPQFEGFGCTATQYCAAMTIDSSYARPEPRCPGIDGDREHGRLQRLRARGPEPVNCAYITKSGGSQAPANPLFSGILTDPVFTAINPNLSEDLPMNPGDRILIHMHDAPAGFQVNLFDLTTGQSGSMTASIANGFGHVLFTPSSSTCHEAVYAFHPEYATANPRGNTWTAHSYNIAMFRRSLSRLTCRRSRARSHSSMFCDLNTGANCVDPPDGAPFYPFFTTGTDNGTCTWQEGGNFIPGTIDHFGGSAAAEFGSLLRIVFPVPTFTTAEAIQDFNSGDMPSACPVGPFFGGGGR